MKSIHKKPNAQWSANKAETNKKLPALPALEFLSFLHDIINTFTTYSRTHTFHLGLGYLAPNAVTKNKWHTKKHFKDTQAYLKYHIQNHNIIEIS